jgi:hypothetical protein
MYRDIEAAKTLGMTDNSVETVMDERGAGTAFDYLVKEHLNLTQFLMQ